MLPHDSFVGTLLAGVVLTFALVMIARALTSWSL
jgi:hypothetical protein